eukprot:TRINITY_DN788_c0_g1_i4.p1 TRINITY_DN788_c0_g1~~TRINITY_DN788_c0_g1_i4.p1  ORF type:complete len:248 (+),score=15.03 TRINITY_DN788_c0_g1_i4:66-809(+)
MPSHPKSGHCSRAKAKTSIPRVKRGGWAKKKEFKGGEAIHNIKQIFQFYQNFGSLLVRIRAFLLEDIGSNLKKFMVSISVAKMVKIAKQAPEGGFTSTQVFQMLQSQISTLNSSELFYSRRLKHRERNPVVTETGNSVRVAGIRGNITQGSRPQNRQKLVVRPCDCDVAYAVGGETDMRESQKKRQISFLNKRIFHSPPIIKRNSCWRSQHHFAPRAKDKEPKAMQTLLLAVILINVALKTKCLITG